MLETELNILSFTGTLPVIRGIWCPKFRKYQNMFNYCFKSKCLTQKLVPKSNTIKKCDIKRFLIYFLYQNWENINTDSQYVHLQLLHLFSCKNVWRIKQFYLIKFYLIKIFQLLVDIVSLVGFWYFWYIWYVQYIWSIWYVWYN